MYGISNGQQKGNGGGGSGSANYTKIESTIPTSAWVSSTPSWIGQNALTWRTYNVAYYIQGGTEDLGLSAGGSYSAVLTIDGTDYDAENAQAMDANGMVTYVASFNNNAAMLQIIDHCAGIGDSGPIAGNGYLVMVIPMSETVPSSIIVKSFSAAGGISAIISNSAIKVNSSVTMYIDYNGKIKAVGKADGSLTLSASATPTVEIPYAIEITDTNTEGLFEVVNGYVPTIPEITLPQWHTIYEDTTGTGVTDIDNLTEPLKGGELYRITMKGDFYIFCLPDDGDNASRQINIMEEDLGPGNNSLNHKTMALVYHERSLSLAYAAAYQITETGISDYTFSTSSGIKITKLEVYR